MWLTGKRTLFTLYSVLGIQLHCTVFVSWLFCTLWWLHTMCLYHVCACTVDYVHRLCIVHVLYCLSWLQTVYCALPVFIVNVHEHYLHWLCCTLWNAHCEMHTVKCTLWNAHCVLNSATASSTSPTFTLCGRTASHGKPPLSTILSSCALHNHLPAVCQQCVATVILPHIFNFHTVRTIQSVFTLVRIHLPCLLHVLIKSWNFAPISAQLKTLTSNWFGVAA